MIKIAQLGKFGKFFSADKILFGNLLADLVIVIFQGVLIAVFYRFIPPVVPLFFSRPWGEEMLAEKQNLVLLPLISLLILIINFILADKFWEKEKLLAKIFIFTSTLVIILLSVTLLEILFLTTL